MNTQNWFTLLRIIGNSLIDYRRDEIYESIELYNLAFSNRIDLLYLEALAQNGCLEKLRDRYEQLKKRHSKIIADVTRVGTTLRERGIRYAFMKTLRPYPATPNDIDMFYLGDKSEIHEAIKVLIDLGYRKSLEQQGEIGFWDPNRDSLNPRTDHEIDFLDLDMYKSATVKSFCYFLEDQFKQYICFNFICFNSSFHGLSALEPSNYHRFISFLKDCGKF